MKTPDPEAYAAMLKQDQGQRLQDRLEVQGADRSGSKQEMREVCQDFEAMFIQKMWQAMRSTLPKDGLFHSRMQEKYLEMFDRAFAQSMARQGGLGLSEMLMTELRERLEGQTRGAAPAEPLAAWKAEEPGSRAQPDGGDAADGQGSAEAVGSGAARGAEARPVHRLSREEAYARMEELARRIEDLNGPAGGSGRSEAVGGPGQAAEAGSSGRATFSRASGLQELVQPVEGELTSGFGWRQDPITGERAWHSGIDFGAPLGSPVKACWPGRVAFAGDREGYGRLVILEHQNGWRSFYAHNRSNRVSEGQEVAAGETIAEVGQSGRSTGPHLHFELRQGEIAWNPRQIERRLLAGLSIGRRA